MTKVDGQRRDPLDFRGRIGESGQRYGKVVDWRMSELRATEVVDGLCANVKDFKLSVDRENGRMCAFLHETKCAPS